MTITIYANDVESGCSVNGLHLTINHININHPYCLFEKEG